ncbi:hypothetical protein ACFLZN_00150 [Nanoarchaeota archaeon]
MVEENLIKAFVNSYKSIRDLIRSGDIGLAKKRYTELYDLYERINNSNLDMQHKTIAFDQVSIIRQELISGKLSESTSDLTSRRNDSVQKNPPQKNKYISTSNPTVIKKTNIQNSNPVVQNNSTQNNPTNYRRRPQMNLTTPILIAIGLLIILASVLIVIEPEIVGLSFFDEQLGGGIGLTFDHNGQHTMVFRHIPESLRLSGKLTSGIAKVYANINGEKKLVFDSEIVDLVEGIFYDICIETCVINVSSPTIILDIEVNGGNLFLSEANYQTPQIKNNPPEWKGTRKIFRIRDSLVIDLKNYFFDEDGDELTFLATETKDVDVKVKGSQVEITNKGISKPIEIDFIASDMKDITTVTVKLQNT